jgi:general secretion pathway protein F
LPAFAYTGLNSQGRSIKGVQTADTVSGLKASLRREGVYLTAVTEANASGRTRETTDTESQDVDFGALFDRISPKQVAYVTRLLSTLLIAGVTLPEALGALTDQVESARFKGVLSDLSSRVNEGSSLAAALGVHPSVFTPLYVNMVRAGESSGALETVLIRLADFMDQQEELKGKLGTALLYPIAMALVATFVVGLLMVKVVPQVTELFSDQEMSLPFSTRILIGVSDFVGGYWWLILLVGAAGSWAFAKWRMTAAGRASLDHRKLTMPFLGDLLRKVAVARFSRTLSTMLASGVQLLEALDIVSSLLGNVTLEKAVSDARDDIREGEGIAPALKRSGEFPPLVTHMISVGERSGELESMLSDVADAYDREVNTAINRSMAVLEPLMIVGMAVVVGFIVFAIMQPIIQMNSMANL